MTACPQTLPGCTVLPPMELVETVAADIQPKSKNRKAADRFAVLNVFVDMAMGELNRSEIAVWLVLYRDTWNGIAETSQADIARRAGLSDRTVRRAISRLMERGLVTLVYRGGLNRGKSRYRVRGTPVSG